MVEGLVLWMRQHLNLIGGRLSGFGVCVQGFRLQFSGFRFQVSGFRFQASSFRFQGQVSGSRFQFSGSRFQVSGSRFQVSGSRFQVSAFGVSPRWPLFRINMKCVSIEKISGNEVHFTIVLILLVKIMLCSQLHCQKT